MENLKKFKLAHTVHNTIKTLFITFGAVTIATHMTVVRAAGVPLLDEVLLEKIVVDAKSQNMLGISDSASEGTVTAEQLKSRPLLRPAEVLEAVPGMIVTQHSGGGKANQYFLRGFNLDHGSDFATSVNGMPVNNVSHAHGQGYTDLNFLIPELIGNLRYRKGVYAAEDGDFAVAGSARIDYVRNLTSPFVDLTVGEYGYKRFLTTGSQQIGAVNVLGAIELAGNDGPWDNPENLDKKNAVLRLSSGTAFDGAALTVMAYQADWTSTEHVPERAILNNEIGRYGNIAPTDGGKTHRYSVSGDWAKTDETGSWKANAYLVDYSLNLISTPSGLLDGQHEQADDRRTLGGQLLRSQVLNIADKSNILEVGVQLRHDRIANLGLYQTTNRNRDSVTREDAVKENAVGFFANVNTPWSDWLRSNVGFRGDYIKATVKNKAGAFNTQNDGSADDAQLSPKLGVVFGPFGNTEIFANWGHGFHSNDARGSTASTNAIDGTFISSIPLIAKAKGSELGLRTQLLPHLHSSFTLWQVELDSELVYIGDSGVTEPKGGSKRRGIEWSNYYQYDGLIVDADVAYSHARFNADTGSGKYIPNAIPLTASFAVTYDHGGDWFGGLRARYLGAYSLEESGEKKSQAFWTTNLKLGYRYDKNIQFNVDVLNLFNSKANDIEYFGASCTVTEGSACGGSEGIEGRLIHPLEPRSLRLAMRVNF